MKESMKKLSINEIEMKLLSIHGWWHQNDCIQKRFNFKNYDETVAFVKSVIQIAQTNDHHPLITFGYKDCKVEYMTHSIQGISDKDLSCAHEINQLVE